MRKILFLIFALLILIGCSIGGGGGQKEEKQTLEPNFCINPPNDTIILVHGAWHGAWCWIQTEPYLKAKGFNVINVNLPAHGEDQTPPGVVTLDLYVQTLLNIIDKQSGKVILVGHSAGGITISQAAELRPDKIKGLVYVAAFLLRNGETLLSVAMQDTESIAGKNLIVNPESGYIDINRSALKEAFYNKTDCVFYNYARKRITPEPLFPFVTPLQLSCNYDGVKKFYIKTKFDNAITPALQDQMLANTPVNKIYEINSDHSPFFSKNEKLVRILVDISDTLNRKKNFDSCNLDAD